MSGKYPICSRTIISALILTALLRAFGFGAVNAENEPRKDKLIVNGFQLKEYGTAEIEGLRNKAVADLFYMKGSYAQAIKYYEKAARFLPNEADIYLRLGDIYHKLNVDNMSVIYFRTAYQKYELPENFGKTQKFKYLALIWLARSYEITRAFEDGHKKAEEILSQIQGSYEKEIREFYPEVYAELNSVTAFVIGNVIVPEPKRTIDPLLTN